MPMAVISAIALIGAALHIRRHKDQADRPGFKVDTFLVWWLVVAIGIGSIIGAMFHLFDGPQIAEEIGYTRGNGGFQYENAMGDMAIGIAGLLCARFRGYFWFATIVILTIQYFGDAGGHIYYWIADDNTKPDNIGFPLYLDFLQPILAMVLYWMSWKRGGDARPQSSTPHATT